MSRSFATKNSLAISPPSRQYPPPPPPGLALTEAAAWAGWVVLGAAWPRYGPETGDDNTSLHYSLQTAGARQMIRLQGEMSLSSPPS